MGFVFGIIGICFWAVIAIGTAWIDFINNVERSEFDEEVRING